MTNNAWFWIGGILIFIALIVWGIDQRTGRPIACYCFPSQNGATGTWYRLPDPPGQTLVRDPNQCPPDKRVARNAPCPK